MKNPETLRSLYLVLHPLWFCSWSLWMVNCYTFNPAPAPVPGFFFSQHSSFSFSIHDDDHVDQIMHKPLWVVWMIFHHVTKIQLFHHHLIKVIFFMSFFFSFMTLFRPPSKQWRPKHLLIFLCLHDNSSHWLNFLISRIFSSFCCYCSSVWTQYNRICFIG